MIIKSMSRKVPSFGQLIGYIDRDEGHEDWRIRHNVMGRDPARIRAEFEQNGARLQQRKNGVYLYHEILSITRARGLAEAAQKARLREIVEQYIAARCPENLVYGGLHQDKDHSFHYHLMISANRAGEAKRLRLSKAQFREIQVQLERHVLRTMPELEQKVAIDKRAEVRKARGEAELERRTGAVPKKDQLRARVSEALESAADRDGLMEALGRHDLELYVRGSTLGVIDHESGKRHRLKTLDLELADRVEGVMLKQSLSRENTTSAGEKEKTGQTEEDREGPEQVAPERDDRSADNETYVKYDSNTDLKSEPASQQNSEASQERDPQHEAVRREPEPYSEPSQDDELSERQREWKAHAEARRVKKKNRDRDGQEREQ